MKDSLTPLREKFTVAYLTELGIPHLVGVHFEDFTDSTGDDAIELELVLADGKHIGLEAMKDVVDVLDGVRTQAMRMDEKGRFVYTNYTSETPNKLTA